MTHKEKGRGCYTAGLPEKRADPLTKAGLLASIPARPPTVNGIALNAIALGATLALATFILFAIGGLQ